MTEYLYRQYDKHYDGVFKLQYSKHYDEVRPYLQRE
jgi:hypothetical protein